MASRSAPASGQPDAHFDQDMPRIHADNYWLLVLGMMLTSIMQVLDTTIANVALPHMQSALGATPETVTWVLTSYIITNAVMLPLSGWFAARFGARNVFIYTVIGFVVTSMLCGMAQTIQEMVIYRALQGIAGAFFLPLSQSIMLDATRPSKHGQMIAIWSSVVVLGPIAGPVLGGWLTENWNWRWVFYVNAPVGALSLAILVAQLPRIKEKSRKFDMVGFLLIAMALAALQLLLDRGNQIDWFDSTEAWIYLFVLISATWASIVHIITAEDPLFPRAMFLDLNLVVAFGFTMITAATLYATSALLPPLLQNLYGFDTMETGLLLAPRGVGFLVGTQILGIVSRRNLDVRITVAFGLLAVALGQFLMTGWSLTFDKPHILLPGFVQGIGMALVFIPLNTSAYATLAPQFRTDAASIVSLGRAVGSSIGISVLVSLFARNVQVSHSDMAAQISTDVTGVVDASTITGFPVLGETALRLIDAEVNRQAAMIAYINDFDLMVWMTLAMLPLVLLIRQPRRYPRD